MHPSDNGLSPLLGIHQSTEVPAVTLVAFRSEVGSLDIFGSGTYLISLLTIQYNTVIYLVVALFLVLFVLGATSSLKKSPRLRRFKSDLVETWQECFFHV